MKQLFYALIMLWSLNGSAQQEYPFEYIKKLSYFDAYSELCNRKEAYKGDKYEETYWQALGTIYCFTGREEKALQCFDIRNELIKRAKAGHLDVSNKEILSIDSMLNMAKNYDVVMLNEAHHRSEHRAILYHLLPRFYELGYRYLALEALCNEDYTDTLLSQRTYPVYTKSGIYINDPVFGQVIRRALQLGYTLIPYDSYQSDRERFSADNIEKAYNPEKGKLLVHAGYAHILRTPERELMGSYLKKLLKRDYLAISNVYNYNVSGMSIENSGNYGLLADTSKGYDYFLLSPGYTDSLNIPGWYKLMNCQYAPLSDFHPMNFTLPALVQVYNRSEKDGVPVYQYLIEEDEKKDILLAFPSDGDYTLTIVNKEGTQDKLIDFKRKP